MTHSLRLGVNIDHVATLRNARGGSHPCPVRAAILAQSAGADGITLHLREDRRHIRDDDVRRMKEQVSLPLNLEMAATEEMLEIALRTQPNACCIVPERRTELTTEGGLNVVMKFDALQPMVRELKARGIRVSLFVDADENQLRAAAELGADIVELHTGAYSHAHGEDFIRLLGNIQRSAALTEVLKLECHAGHGLNYENVGAIAAIPQMVELNIGHFIMGEALYVGLPQAIRMMRDRMGR